MALTKRKRLFIDFSQESLPFFHVISSGAAAAVTKDIPNRGLLSSGDFIDFIGRNNNLSSAVPAVLDTVGWRPNISTTSGDGIEFSFGQIAGAGSGIQFVPATTPAFFIRGVFKMGTDRSKTLVAGIGFHTAATYHATGIVSEATIGNTYNDVVFCGVTTNGGALKTSTTDGGAAATLTALAATAIANDAYFAVEINCSAAGAFTYKVGTGASVAAAKAALAADASAVAFSFTVAPALVPFIHINAAGNANTTKVCLFEAGVQ